MRSFPFKLYKYLAKDFTAWFLGILMILLILVFLLEFSELLRRGQGMSTVTYSILTEMALLKLPYSIEELLPFGVFFAAILCLWKLTRSRELTIIRSVGLSVWQFLLPIAFVAFLIGIIDLCILNPATSLMKQRYDWLDSKYLLQKMYSLNISDSGIWIRQMEESHSTIYRIGKVNLEQTSLHDISLYRYDTNNRFLERIDAQNGWLIEDQLHMNTAWIHKKGHFPEKHETLAIPSTLTLEKLSETHISPDSMSFWELSHFIGLLEKSGLLRDEYKLYWHALIARVFWLVSMIFLAGACILNATRRGKTPLFILMGILSGFGLYVLKDITYVMGSASTIPVILAAWTPILITFVLGAGVLLYFEDG